MASSASYCWVIQDPETGNNVINEGPRALPAGWTTPYTYTYDGNEIKDGITLTGFNNLTDEELHYYGWLPHVLIDPPHTWYDKFLGSTFVIEPNSVVETNQYRPKTPEEIAEDLQPIKDEGKKLLDDSDWTTIPDVANPEKSNPYLSNQDAFIQWRSQVRYIVVNTKPGDTFPLPPEEAWVTT